MQHKARAGKRPTVRRIVLLSLVFLVLLEPIVMYKVLEHQKEAREAQRALIDDSFSSMPAQTIQSVGE
jgi:hypothetical protein